MLPAAPLNSEATSAHTTRIVARGIFNFVPGGAPGDYEDSTLGRAVLPDTLFPRLSSGGSLVQGFRPQRG
jgi:hypothetical protein